MSSWRQVPFGSLGVLYDGPYATPTRVAQGPYFLNIASLQDGRLDLGRSDHVSEEEFATWTKRIAPQEGDLLFSYETRLGEAALMPEGIRACLGRRMALIRPDRSRVDPRYLLYLYLSPSFQATIARNTVHGATVSRISLSTMGTWEARLPALIDQQAVAEVLGAIDDKITANTRLALSAQQLASYQFAQAVRRTHSSGQESRSTTIGNLIDGGHLIMSDGYRTSRSELGETGYRIIRVPDVTGGTITPTGPDRVSEEFRGPIGVKAGREGDIVVTTKGTVGRVAHVMQIDEPIVYSPQICFFRVEQNPILERSFLRHWLNSSDFRRQAAYRMHNTDMAPYISLSDMRSIQLEIPLIDQQEAVAELPRALEEKAQASSRENRSLSAFRDGLLPQLMSGKLRVRDAEKQVQ